MQVPLQQLPSPDFLAPIVGDTLQVVWCDGRAMVSLRPLCEFMGLDYLEEYGKLVSPDCDWASLAVLPETGPDGVRSKLTLMNLELVPFWLTTVEPTAVNPAIRESLERLHYECAAFEASSANGPVERLLEDIFGTDA